MVELLEDSGFRFEHEYNAAQQRYEFVVFPVEGKCSATFVPLRMLLDDRPGYIMLLNGVKKKLKQWKDAPLAK